MLGALPIVYVVDDDISVRESLELLIRTAGWQAELFESAQDFLRCPKATLPSCLVLDVNTPRSQWLAPELQKPEIAAARAERMPIIFISGYGDVPSTVQAMKAGAVEFLTKPFSDEVLLSAIEHALQRSRDLLDEQAALQDLRNRHGPAPARREREVMALVVRGLLNKQVGFELGISEITVKAHRGRVMEKMRGAGLSADLVIMAARLHATAAKKTSATLRTQIRAQRFSARQVRSQRVHAFAKRVYIRKCLTLGRKAAPKQLHGKFFTTDVDGVSQPDRRSHRT